MVERTLQNFPLGLDSVRITTMRTTFLRIKTLIGISIKEVGKTGDTHLRPRPSDTMGGSTILREEVTT
jgi:hypothetical protein